MKKKITILLFWQIIIIASSTTEAVAQWIWNTPTPSGYQLNDIGSPNGNDYWMVGEEGIIMKYDKAGNEFTYHTAINRQNLNSIDFASESSGWIVGDSGVIMKYDGSNWTNYLSPTESNLLSVSVVDENTAFASGSSGLVIKFSNNQWSILASPYTNLSLSSISALSENNVSTFGASADDYNHFTVEEHYIDGSWIQEFETGMEVTEVFETDIENGWAAGSVQGDVRAAIFYRSENGGDYYEQYSGYDTWGYGYNYISDIYFTDNSHGWAVEVLDDWIEHPDIFAILPTFGILKYSANTWEKVYHGEAWELNDVCSDVPEHCIAVGKGGQILEISDNEANMLSSFATGFLKDIFLIDENNGWAVGDRGIIWHLVDGEWSLFPPFTENDLTGIYFTDVDHGWVVGGNPDETPGAKGVIFEYSEGTWTQVAWLDQYLNSVSFSNPEFGCAVGENGKIVKYDGQSWSAVSSPSNLRLMGVDVVNDHFIVIVGEYGTLIVSDGNNFTLRDIGTSNDLRSVSYSSPSNGWIVGQQGVLFRCNNTTFTQYPSLSGIAMDVKTIDENNAICVGYRTISKFDGESWHLLNDDNFRITSNMYLRAVDFADDSTGTIVGTANAGGATFWNNSPSHSLIISTTCGGIYTNNKDELKADPASVINLYPNPCTLMLNMDLEFDRNCHALVIIADITGKVKKIPEAKITLSKGFNHISIPVSSLERGVYIIQIISEFGSISKRFVKI